MSTHYIGFYEDMTKNIFQLSSNMHLLSLLLDVSTCKCFVKPFCCHYNRVIFEKLKQNKTNKKIYKIW